MRLGLPKRALLPRGVIGADPIKVVLVRSVSHPEAQHHGCEFPGNRDRRQTIGITAGLAFVPHAKSIAIHPKNADFASMAQDVGTAERMLKIPLQTYKVSTEGEMLDAFSKME